MTITASSESVGARRVVTTARIAPPTGLAVVLALAATHAAVDLPIGAFGALLPSLRTRFGFSRTEIAGLVSIFAAASLLTQPVAGRVADRIGARKVAAGGAIAAAVLLSLLGIVTNAAVLCALLVIGGLASAAFHPASATVAGQGTTRQRRLGVSAFGAGGTFGLAIGPLLVVLLSANGGFAVAPWLMVPGIALGVTLWHVVPRFPRPPRVSAICRTPMLRGPVAVLTASATLAALASVTFISAMPIWLTEHHGFADHSALIGWTLAAFSIASAAGGVVGSWAASRVNVRVLVSGSFAASAVPLCLVLVADPGTVAYFGAIVVAGMLLNAPMPVLMVAAQDSAPDAAAAASGMVMGFATGSAGVVYLGVGFVADTTALSVGMLFGMLAVLPAALVASRALATASASLDERLARGVAPTGCCAATPCVSSHDVTTYEQPVLSVA